MRSTVGRKSSASDEELIRQFRSGDLRAGGALLARHRAAIETLDQLQVRQPPFSSGQATLGLVRRGAGRELPFRGLWLAVHSQRRCPPEPSGERGLWTAFLALPPAWRTVLWHHEVEGDGHRQAAGYAGMSEEQGKHVLALSYAALKWWVTASQMSKGTERDCRELAVRYRVSSPARFTKPELRTLREHARRCDDCLGMIRQLFVIEHALRDALAGALLGAHADAYLSRRPLPRRLRVPRGPVPDLDMAVKIFPSIPGSSWAPGAAAHQLNRTAM